MNIKKDNILIGKLPVDILFKDIKNVHLSVNPPKGNVKISAPLAMEMDTIRVFIISKMGWIRKQQEKFQKQEREEVRSYIPRESHYFLGKRYLLQIQEEKSSSRVALNHDVIKVHVRPGADRAKIQNVLEKWYRDELKNAVSEIVVKYEEILKIQVASIKIIKMKTKWGTCNKEKRTIHLNLELIKKPANLIEYIVVHEMIHFFERNHNAKFNAYMDKYLPKWRSYREELNRLPVGQGDWEY